VFYWKVINEWRPVCELFRSCNCTLGRPNGRRTEFIYSGRSLSLCIHNLQREFYKSDGLFSSVMWLQLLRKQRNTGTSVVLIAEILAPPWCWLQKHTHLRAHNSKHPADLWNQSRLIKFTCARSWRLSGSNPAVCVCKSEVAREVEPDAIDVLTDTEHS